MNAYTLKWSTDYIETIKVSFNKGAEIFVCATSQLLGILKTKLNYKNYAEITQDNSIG